MVRRCSLTTGHEGRHRHVPLAGSLAGSGLGGYFQAEFEPDLPAGGQQEPRSDPGPTSPTSEGGSAATEAPGPKVTIQVGLIDLRGIPDHLCYNGGAYSAALDQARRAGWGFIAGGGVPVKTVLVGRVTWAS